MFLRFRSYVTYIKNVFIVLKILKLLHLQILKLLSVENNGVEPLTYCVQGSRSSQLS